MFKLLTEEQKQKVAREYTRRRTVVMLLALAIVLMAGIIGLLPSYVLSNARQNEALERARAIDNPWQTENQSDLQVWLKETNRKLKVLSPTLDTNRPSDFIGRILDQKVTGIRVTGFSLVRVKGEIALSVNGVARDRQTLITFENRINASGHFSKVALPISNLAKDKDIDFQIKFTP